MFVAYMTKPVPRAVCQRMARQRCDSSVGNYLFIKSSWEFLMDLCACEMDMHKQEFPEFFCSNLLKPFRETSVQQQEKYDSFFLNFLQGSQNLSFHNIPAASLTIGEPVSLPLSNEYPLPGTSYPSS